VVIVDTVIWSMAYRRKKPLPEDQPFVEALSVLIQRTQAVIIGAIRQELLSGIKERLVFERLSAAMDAFPDFIPETEDYKRAAEFCNICRAHGVQGSNTDFLICAVAFRKNWLIFSSDGDFEHYKEWIPVKLYPFSPQGGGNGQGN
jgi:predicted nucleic acid-binding protein